MHVRLVTRVKNDRVLRGAEHPVQSDRQLNDAQVRAEVPAGARHVVNQEPAVRCSATAGRVTLVFQT